MMWMGASLLACVATGLDTVDLHGKRRLNNSSHSGASRDAYSRYEGHRLVNVTMCDQASAVSASSALISARCMLLSEHEVELEFALPAGAPPGTCATGFAICPPDFRDGRGGASGPSGPIVISSDDAGRTLRDAGGVPRRWRQGTSLFEDPPSSFYHEWRDLNDIEIRLQQIAAAAPGIVTVEPLLPLTHQNRQIQILRIRGENWMPAYPRVLFTFTLHAREWIATMTGIYAAEYLVAQVLREPELLDKMEIIVVPVVNPDGFDFSVNEDRFFRKNRRDNQDGCFGVDLNRNFDIGWGGFFSTSTDTCSNVYIGQSRRSEPETRAIMSVLDEALVYVHLDIHSFGELILGSWAYDPRDHPRKHEIDELADIMRDEIASVNGKVYSYSTNILASGLAQDVTSARGGLGYTIELPPASGGMFAFAPPPSIIVPTANETIQAFIAAIRYAKGQTPTTSTVTATTTTSATETTLTSVTVTSMTTSVSNTTTTHTSITSTNTTLTETTATATTPTATTTTLTSTSSTATTPTATSRTSTSRTSTSATATTATGTSTSATTTSATATTATATTATGTSATATVTTTTHTTTASTTTATTATATGTATVSVTSSTATVTTTTTATTSTATTTTATGTTATVSATSTTATATTTTTATTATATTATATTATATSTTETSTATATTTTATTTTLGRSYIDGVPIANVVGNFHCGSWFGTLEEAENRCDEEPDCYTIFDFDCDGNGWRFCSNSIWHISGSGFGGPRGCTKIAKAIRDPLCSCVAEHNLCSTTCNQVIPSMLSPECQALEIDGLCNAGLSVGIHELYSDVCRQECAAPGGDVFVEGPRVGNAALAQCSAWYGGLEDAEARCKGAEGCSVIHDYQCDGMGWRYCSGTLEQAIASSPGTNACTRVRPAVEGPTYVPGPRVSNSAGYLCSSWHGHLAEARSLCDADPTCTVIYDFNCDGWSWRHCSADIQTIKDVDFGTGSCTQLNAARVTTTATTTATAGPRVEEGPTFIYVEGPRIGNGALSWCSTWHGVIHEARAICDADPSCETLHDFGCDGQGWRYCAHDVEALRVWDGSRACTEVRVLQPMYVEGPRISDNAVAHCDAAIGTLTDAQTRCSEDPACTMLHDFGCDGLGWRHCTSGIQSMVSIGAGTEACTQVAFREGTVSTTTMPPFVEGPRVSNHAMALHCSGWYGALEEAQARCDAPEAFCGVLHDYGCDGIGWRYCQGSMLSIQAAWPGSQACTMMRAVPEGDSAFDRSRSR